MRADFVGWPDNFRENIDFFYRMRKQILRSNTRYTTQGIHILCKNKYRVSY